MESTSPGMNGKSLGACTGEVGGGVVHDLTVKDLLDLVVADVPDASGRIEKIFEWHFERVKTTAQWVLGAAASLFVSSLIPFFKAELQLT